MIVLLFLSLLVGGLLYEVWDVGGADQGAQGKGSPRPGACHLQ